VLCLQSFCELVKLGADLTLPGKEAGFAHSNFLEYLLLNFYKLTKRNGKRVESCCIAFLHENFKNQLRGAEYNVNPIFLIAENLGFRKSQSFTNMCMYVFGYIMDVFVHEKPLLIKKRVVPNGYHPEWKLVMEALNIPEEVTFEPLGYLLFNVNLSALGSKTNQQYVLVVFSLIGELMKKGFGPDYVSDGVVPPLHALLYNAVLNHTPAMYLDPEICDFIIAIITLHLGMYHYD
jgi:hypothetical protein